MEKLNIIKVGATVEHGDHVTLVISGEDTPVIAIKVPKGDLPPDCAVVFMEKESWKRLKQEMLE